MAPFLLVSYVFFSHTFSIQSKSIKPITYLSLQIKYKSKEEEEEEEKNGMNNHWPKWNCI